MAHAPYVELAVMSNFSFLRAASHPEELAVAAARLRLAGLVLADRNTVAGVVRAHMAAKEAGLPYQPGCRLAFRDATPDIIVLPRNLGGWQDLCRLLSTGNLRAPKGECWLDCADLLQWGANLSLIAMPPEGQNGEGQSGDTGESETALATLAAAFPRALRVAAVRRFGASDARDIAARAALSTRLGVPLVAAGDVRFHRPQRRRVQDVLTCIREHVTLAQAGRLLEANAERHLKDGAEMSRLFAGYEQAVAESLKVFGEVSFSLEELRYQYPDETPPGGLSCAQELTRLAYEGARQRYPHGPPQRVLDQIVHELKLIGELQYEPYFLTVHDIVRFARSQGILCQGRGSAANSTVCYCIGITDVDPALTDLLFERFISPERREPPDIDVDFEHERREEVIQYIYAKYGRERAGLAASVITYRARSAAREVGKAFGLSQDAIGALSGSVWGHSSANLGEREAAQSGLDMADPAVAQVLEIATEINGFPRHLSQHVGGFVITRDRLDSVIPLMNTAMEGRTQVEWDKDDLESLGILKIDVLALGMLTCLRKAFDLLEERYGQQMTLATMPKEDPRTYAMIQRADTIGVFQIESRAQMSMLPRLKPAKFYDLVIEVAIVRPGPIQGDMVHPYLRRRQGKEKVSYPSAELEQVLGRTLGVPLFQEQAMKIAIVAAGFSPGEADKLRRAMATFRRVGTIHTFQRKMVDGMVARGYEAEFAERCFRQIEGFGEYGFPESHAASFALLVYASCWLKCHYPDVFAAAILNSQPMGFYSPSQLVRDAREHGIAIRPPDVNLAGYDCILEPDGDADARRRRLHPRHREMMGEMMGEMMDGADSDIRATHAVRLGLRYVKGIGEAEALAIAIAQRDCAFASVRDLWRRAGLSRGAMEKLADADAFRSLGLDRRAALWQVRALDNQAADDRETLFDLPAQGGRHDDLRREERVSLPAMPAGEHVIQDYRALSLSLKGHPVGFVRETLASTGVRRSSELETIAHGSRVRIAGLVMVRQRPGSAKGVVFMTLEDETGVANAIVWPKVMEQFRPVVMGARFVEIYGMVQKADGVIHVVARSIADRTPMLAALSEALQAQDEVNGETGIGSPHIGSGGVANADEMRRPVLELRNRTRPRSRLARLLNDAPELRHDYERLAKPPASQAKDVPPAITPQQIADPLRKVLPKGRNFQ